MPTNFANDTNHNNSKARSINGVTDSAGTPTGGGGSASFTTITASATTGTATVACGTNTPCWCDVTTSGNITLNVTGSVKADITLVITLGGTHTLAFQYNGVTGNVKWPGNQTGSFGTVSGTVFTVEGKADGTTLRITNYL